MLMIGGRAGMLESKPALKVVEGRYPTKREVPSSHTHGVIDVMLLPHDQQMIS